jgi:hypothetical protein
MVIEAEKSADYPAEAVHEHETAVASMQADAHGSQSDP